jgi:hypothetical protein
VGSWLGDVTWPPRQSVGRHGFDACVNFGCPSGDAPNIVAFIAGQTSSRGASTGSDDRLVLRSPKAQPPDAIAISVDRDAPLGVEFMFCEAVKQVDQD